MHVPLPIQAFSSSPHTIWAITVMTRPQLHQGRVHCRKNVITSHKASYFSLPTLLLFLYFGRNSGSHCFHKPDHTDAVDIFTAWLLVTAFGRFMQKVRFKQEPHVTPLRSQQSRSVYKQKRWCQLVETPGKFNFYSFCFRCSKPSYIQHEMHMLCHVWIIPQNWYNKLFHIIIVFLLPWRVYQSAGYVKDKERGLAASLPLGLQWAF